jgi:protein-S-isoprenylcysteine O-methyltransferase Ste14
MTRLLLTVRALLFPAVVALIFFTSAGRLDLPVAWALLAAFALFLLLMALLGDPAMMRERAAPGPGSKDRVTRPLSALLMIAHWVVAGLDVGRFEWTTIPFAAQVAGLAGYVVSVAVVLWAVLANPFYSSVVRVQADRGQRPIAHGPYRFVRHPGYAGTMAAMLAGGVALGSWVAMLPVLLIVALFVRRTLLEDRLLQAELDGYAEYARAVRYRLIVGVL